MSVLFTVGIISVKVKSTSPPLLIFVVKQREQKHSARKDHSEILSASIFHESASPPNYESFMVELFNY